MTRRAALATRAQLLLLLLVAHTSLATVDDGNSTNTSDSDAPTSPPSGGTTSQAVAGTTLPVDAGTTVAVPAGTSYYDVVPTQDCDAAADVFDPTLLRCSSCTDLDAQAEPAADETSCTCRVGFVECEAGEFCLAETAAEFVAEKPLNCRVCPTDTVGNPTAPTRDRRRCLPCGLNATVDGVATLGFSAETGDCLCPPLHALVERGHDGTYLASKQCVLCSADHFPAPQDVPSSVYDCGPCPDPARMQRRSDTGACECTQSQSADGGSSVLAGGLCVDMEEFNRVNSLYPEASAIRVVFRDAIDENPEAWENRQLGQSLGIAQRDGELYNALELGEAQAQSLTVDSAAFKWLYIRSATGCLLGNSTACQCISNLCVLALYEDAATVCRFVTQQLYEGRASVSADTPGHRVGLPWITYEPEPARATLEDASLTWRYTLGEEIDAGTANTLEFWLATYNLEGVWMGWERLDSQLELCKTLGGYSEVPSSSRLFWRRFGSSLSVECDIPAHRLLRQGLVPTFYELFMRNADGTLVPVPVRILNTARGQVRPNLNVATDDIEDDFLVRRFVLVDGVSGKEGSSSVLFDTLVAPRVLRWAAHVTMQIKIREGSDAQIWVPVLTIAYAEKEGVTLADTSTVPASFTSEYAMDTSSFWSTTTVFFVLLCILIFCIACFKAYLVAARYPVVLLAGAADPGIFIPRFFIQALEVLAITFSILIWFHFILAMYWFIIFKGQDVPHLLLPSAFEGEQYVPHDVFLILEACLATACVLLGFLWHMKTFFFLLDWERADPGSDHTHMAKEQHTHAASSGGMPQQGFRQQQHPPQGFGQMLQTGLQAVGFQGFQSQTGYGQQPPGYGQPGQGSFQGYQGYGAGPRPQMMGASQFGAQAHQPGVQEVLAYSNEAPDRGVSAWRSLFVCNELNERLASTRTASHVTWLTMCLFLEGFGLKHWSRWYPGLSSGDHMQSAPYNPVLQFALGACMWMLIILSQLLVSRVASIWLGHDLTDFVDVCAVANISVFVMDEPFHGFYIHGKAPSSKGDWCHTELAKAIHDEAKGIGFTRGLTPESAVQTFEMLLPPHVQIAYNQPGAGGGGESMSVDFREHLYRTFMDIAATRNMIAQRTPPRPTESDVAHLSMHRCTLSKLFDSTIHAMMQASHEVIQLQTRWQRFWGAPPAGGVISLQHPVLFEDKTLMAWSSRTAHGAEMRVAGLGLPTGFEWHLIALEMLLFCIVWRFADSIFLGAAVAFLLNRTVIGLYAAVGRHMLSRTTIIDPMFLL